jgi:iron complex transport system substrate-binding protein
VVFALGLGDRVVGVDSFSNYPPEATTKPKIGNYSAANLEAIIAAAPDLIVAAGITRPDVVAALESRQLAVLILNPNDLPGIFNNLSLVGQVADVSAAAGKLRGDLEGRVATLNAKLQTATTKPRVFFELDPEQYFTVGPKSFIDDLITRAGGVNIAAGAASAYPKLSADQIIAANPEVILLSDEAAGATPAAVQARPGWAGISAVQQQRVLVVDADKTNRPGPRAVEALEELARAIHPELFR